MYHLHKGSLAFPVSYLNTVDIWASLDSYCEFLVRVYNLFDISPTDLLASIFVIDFW